jgi:DinB superfamily
MDLVTFFLRQHGAVHASDVSGHVFPSQRIFDELSDDQMRRRPSTGLNSLVWLLWHMARTEDAAVNPVVGGRDQVLDDEWLRRMNVPWRIIGTGMTNDEVTEMTARADIASVRAYRSAVGLRTREVVGTLRSEAWDEIVGVEDIKRGAVAGAFRDWVDGTNYPWRGWTRGDQLASSALRHNAAHLGEAVTILEAWTDVPSEGMPTPR